MYEVLTLLNYGFILLKYFYFSYKNRLHFGIMTEQQLNEKENVQVGRFEEQLTLTSSGPITNQEMKGSSVETESVS